ncbi:MAG: hypothetical protein JNM25_11340 [Planctomycetes bacterium]|nr:hypothetical protein [Planctomycetota bacterium]
MTTRDDYLKKMHAALEHLQVKASLAKLAARDVREALLKEYDSVQAQLEQAGAAAEGRWEALKSGCDAAWHSFKAKYDEAMARQRKGG